MNASSAPAAVVDLDDVDGLIEADRLGLLRAASMAGAQMRAVASALDEGELDAVRSDAPPRTVVWVSGRGAAENAGAMLAAALGGSVSTPIVVASEAPPWIGALDVLIIAGDDAGDPLLVAAAAMGVRRGARIIVVAPDEGPLREATAGRSVALPPRLQVPDDFTLTHYLAAGMAALQVLVAGRQVDLAALADELDAEALRNSARHELFTNPAKGLAEQMTGRDVVFAGDTAPFLALARYACSVMLRVAHKTVSAVGLADALIAIGTGWGRDSGQDERSIFHDEDFDGPMPHRTRTLVLTTDAQRPALTARLMGFSDVHIINSNDVPDPLQDAVTGDPGMPGPPPGMGSLEQQLALLAVRIEMAAVYQRLVRG
ncbi:MAG: TobH protein [Mycobacterium sp.]